MAKRLIDTGFLRQKWIRKLSPEKKIFLIYLMLECDNGGIIELDFEDVEFWIGKKIVSLDFLPEGYLISLGNGKYFQPKFIEWQYANFPHSKVHQQAQAKRILEKYGLYNPDTKELNLPKSSTKLTQTLPKSQVNANANVIDNANANVNEFEDFWNLYDKKVGDKKKCKKKWDKLKDEQKSQIFSTLSLWKEQFSDKQFQPFPETYLNQERWNDEIQIKKGKIAGYQEAMDESIKDLI